MRTPEEQLRREGTERRRQMRGLMLFAAAAVLFILFRFGVARVFTPGWWRLW